MLLRKVKVLNDRKSTLINIKRVPGVRLRKNMGKSQSNNELSSHK